MAVNGRLTLKSATTISLHERFTSLRNIKPVPATGPIENNSGPLNSRSRSQIQKPRPASPDVYYVPPSQSRRAPSAPEYHGIFESDRFRDRSPSPRDRRRSNSAVRHQTYLQRNPRNIRPQLAFQAAMKLKQRSIKQRLGQRQQNFGQTRQHNFYNHQSSPYKQRRFYNGFQGRRGGYRGYGGYQGYQGMNRWASSHSLASDGTGRGRRRRGGGGGNWRGRGWGRQRGGGNRNGGRYQKPKISKEELDSELDSYMKHTKTVLDKDLDDYMAQGDMSK